MVRVTLAFAMAMALALSASASSAWDLVTSSPRPHKSSRKPSVIEKGYAVYPKASVVTSVVETVVAKPVEKAVTVEKPVTNTMIKVEKVEVAVEKPVVVEKVVERTNVVEKVVERPVEVEKVVTVERPVTNTVEVVRVEKVEVEKTVTNIVEKIVEKPVEVEKIVERQVTNVIEKLVEKPVEIEKIVERQVTNTVEVVKVERVEVEKPVTNIVEKIVEVEKPVERTVERLVTNIVEKVIEKPVIVERQITNVVEKVVYDRSVEVRLAQDKAELERRGCELEAEKASLERRNDELERELEAERSRWGRLASTNSVAARSGKAKTGRPARITSSATYYDRKKGVALFEGKVYVDDENYQLHADKAFVFAGATNDIRRIVAVGHVAMTNELRRAYGDKVSYYRQDGMVVLYAGNGTVAEVRDESKAEDQTVRGSKIKFWIGSEQVEVLDATISAPTSGAGLNIL